MPQRSSTPRWTRGLRPRPEAPLIAAFEPPPGLSAVAVKFRTPGRLERPRLVAAHGLQPLLLHAARLALALGLLVLALLPLPLVLDLGLLDPYVHAHGVAGVEAGQALLEVGGLDLLDGIHFSRPICEGGWLACPGPGLRPGPSRLYAASE